jgi:hypothetical protein
METQAMGARAAALRSRLSTEGQAWVDAAVQRLGAHPTPTAVRVAIAQAGRRLGDDAIDLGGAALDPAPHETWRACDVGRAAVLLSVVAHLPAEAQLRLVTDLIRRGELSEQQSLLRALAWLPDPARFTDVAVDACRTNSEPVFAAIAADNPFPAAHFSDAAFDQLVVKAIFIGLAVRGIRGLADRVTPETVRILSDYAAERRAAGRPVPDDVAYVQTLSEAKT